MTQLLLPPIDSILPWIEANIWNIVGLLSLIIGLLGFLGYKIVIPRTQKWRKEYIEGCLGPEFSDYIPRTSAQKKKDKNNTFNTSQNDEIVEGDIYIQPYFTTLPPNEGEEPGLQINSPILLRNFFLNRVFTRLSKENKVFCLLGDTGTGKTAALAHLLIDYINSHTQYNLPYDIRILSLRTNDVLEEIDKITLEKNKRVILLLDALDENLSAQDPDKQEDFLKSLSTFFGDKRFAFIVITCRSQFFKDARQEFGNLNIPMGGSNPWLHVNKLQLEAFNNHQVQDFLDQTFAIVTYNEQRRAAEDLINKHREIASRPIILTYIRDIIRSNKPINSTLDFYDTIVERVLHRNILSTQQTVSNELLQRWWDMTSEVAGYLYSHQKEHITYDELLNIIKKHNITLPNDAIAENLFQQRSLLTRDKKGFKFSHPSFYEYFLAYRFFINGDDVASLQGMDFSYQIANDIIALFSANQYPYFIQIYQLPEDKLALLMFNIAIKLRNIEYYVEAESKCLTSLDMFRQLSKTNPNDFTSHVANTLHALGTIRFFSNKKDDAEKDFNEALSIFKKLDKTNPNEFLPEVAMTLSNLANLHGDLANPHSFAIAEEEYTEALRIYRKLSESKKNTFLEYVAFCLNNLANLHAVNNKPIDSEKEYYEVLTIYKQLTETHPSRFLPYVGMTLNNIAKLHANTDKNAAEKELKEALKIYRQLSETNPKVFRHQLAWTLRNIAILHSDSNNNDAAEKEFFEAFNIYCQLAINKPDAFLPYKASTLQSMAIFHRKQSLLRTAIREGNEALVIYNYLTNKISHNYRTGIADTLLILSEIHFQMGEFGKAEGEYNEALLIQTELLHRKGELGNIPHYGGEESCRFCHKN